MIFIKVTFLKGSVETRIKFTFCNVYIYLSAELGFVFRDVLRRGSWYCPTKINEIIMILNRWLYYKFIMSATKFNYYCPFWWMAERKNWCSTPSSIASENVFGLFWLISIANQVHLNIYKLTNYPHCCLPLV